MNLSYSCASEFQSHGMDDSLNALGQIIESIQLTTSEFNYHQVAFIELVYNAVTL